MCDHENREQAMVVVAEGVWCDPCLAPLVKALNAAGLSTVASCCGHGRRPSSVLLRDGRALLLLDLADFDALADRWPDINAPLPPSPHSEETR